MPLSVRLLRSPRRVVSSSAPEPLVQEPPQAQAPTLVLESLLSPGPLFLPLPPLAARLPAPPLRRRLQILTILPIAPTKPLSNRWNLTLSLRGRRAVPVVVRVFFREEKRQRQKRRRQSVFLGENRKYARRLMVFARWLDTLLLRQFKNDDDDDDGDNSSNRMVTIIGTKTTTREESLQQA